MKQLFLIPLILLFVTIGFSQEIEIIEERSESEIKLFAVNNTENELEMTLKLDVVGFKVSKASPIKVVIPAKGKEFLTTLTAPVGVACEYQTSASFKVLRKSNPTKEADNTNKTNGKQRMTGIQMNTTKVNIFTMDGCGRCAFVVDYLTKNNIPFVELNTTIHAPNNDLMFVKLAEAKHKGTSIQMPVVVYNGKTSFNIKDLKSFVANLK